MSPLPKTSLSPTQYLELERAAVDCKHEFYRGEMFAMGGASRQHNRATVNLTGLIHAALRQSQCEVLGSDMRVKIDATGLYTYPDLTITCEKPEFEDQHLDTLLNPQVIFEVLSKSTEAYDRGKKFGHYRSLPSLKEYFLVSQDRPQIDRFSLGEGGVWQLNDASGLDASITVGSIDLVLPLREVYARVEFEAEEA
ncbi:hypothetical protein Pla175_50110 [Pirellulimonas nuda]|uniref:Putative restriction endonuclease domain-containing protein n=1 Tax=Pirellulimonas nuda TaxID=2528009 RepID=A0A518DJB8_9BACT|nr:Uma2 family endonuclease [Pirellulimonas nuda]QDU91581.1 hypothetical protein Pla175_50110 [Pirellulimonas nuda]